MKKSINLLLFPLLYLLVQCSHPQKSGQLDFAEIQQDFVIPTEENSLWCYWYWIGDDISKEGITKDLEAMKAAGIGGAFIGNINPEEKNGRVPMLSEDWWDHMVHAVNEGKRIGVDIGAFNCPGWSMSGGPWITSEKAMRYVVYSEKSVTGGKTINLKLERPKKEFQDLYVLAFPKNQLEENYLNASNSTITVSPKVKNEACLLDGKTNVSVKFTESKHAIHIRAKKPISAKSITIYPGEDNIVANCELQALIDGEFVSIRKFNFDRRNFNGQVGPIPFGPLTISFPEVNASQFKLICSDILAKGSFGNISKKPVGFSDIKISEEIVVEDFLGKTLGRMHPTPYPTAYSYIWKSNPNPINDKESAIQQPKVLDISDKMDESGALNWTAPEGEWTIMRFGMTPTGTTNSPAAPQGKGYEVDKANRELVRFHFKQFIGELLKRIPEESKSALKYVIADSYETGSQNWTDGFEQNFEKKYGYNPKKFLPVFSGRIVGSIEESERFLWDLRRIVADDVAYKYVGGLREIANENNLKLWLENYGHWGYPSEFLMHGGQSDLVSGEFWNEGTLGDIECKSASSSAHIYGKPKVSAEAFTASGASFARYPAFLKKRGDWALTEGINHFVMHVYIQQPRDKVPGVNAWFGTEFNRNNTWFKKGKTYFDYLRRAQHLLQKGKYKADVCYFVGEDAPLMTGARNPEIPDGYSYDYINAEVIKDRLSVKDGKFVLPDGMTYDLMVLPPNETMRPELLAKLDSLVAQGGKIYGTAPSKSPSLQNYPQSDVQVKELADKMWGDNSQNIIKYGEGIIFKEIGLQEALNNLGINKDVHLNGQDGVLWTHRTMSEMEIYFLTNQNDHKISFSPTFRVHDMKPQLWNAITGEVRALNEFTKADGLTTIPITMETHESWFVVFTNSGNESIHSGYAKNFPEPIKVEALKNSWQVDFKNKAIGPQKTVEFTELTDWIKNDNDKIKFYSGDATYTTTFNYKKEGELNDVFINLGNLGAIASIKINGINIGTTWMAPFRLNTSKTLKEGENTIEVEVVNVLRNRITGDKKLPEDEKTTSLLVDIIDPKYELIPSGLLGPVSIETYSIKPYYF